MNRIMLPSLHMHVLNAIALAMAINIRSQVVLVLGLRCLPKPAMPISMESLLLPLYQMGAPKAFASNC